MFISESDISCGVYQLANLDSEPKDIVKEVTEAVRERIEENNDGFSFLLFSDSDASGNGIALCDYIRKNELGTCRQTSPRVNPNTDNEIRVWVWDIIPTRLFKFHGIVRPKRVNDDNYVF